MKGRKQVCTRNYLYHNGENKNKYKRFFKDKDHHARVGFLGEMVIQFAVILGLSRSRCPLWAAPESMNKTNKK